MPPHRPSLSRSVGNGLLQPQSTRPGPFRNLTSKVREGLLQRLHRVPPNGRSRRYSAVPARVGEGQEPTPTEPIVTGAANGSLSSRRSREKRPALGGSAGRCVPGQNRARLEPVIEVGGTRSRAISNERTIPHRVPSISRRAAQLYDLPDKGRQTGEALSAPLPR
jgi:hypothetical protein